MDAFYWPAMDIIIWGLTIYGLQKQGGESLGLRVAMILTGVVLWYVLWRSQAEITIGLLEELWSDNFGNLFSTPLTLLEWTTGLFTLGILKLFLTVAFTAGVAYVFYAVNVFSLGFVILPFIVSLLVMGWWFGLLLSGLFLRFGTNIQTLAWAGGFMLMPFSGTYYPVSGLPQWMQTISHFLPSSYIFEGMRVVLYTGQIPMDMLVKSFALNGLCIIGAGFYFVRSFQSARQKGLSHLK